MLETNSLQNLIITFIFHFYQQPFVNMTTLIQVSYYKKLLTKTYATIISYILNPHFTGFLGLYSRIPLRLVLAGMICSSTIITSSGSTFKQFACTTLSNGRSLNSLSYLFSSFNEFSTRWIEPRKFLYLFFENVSVIKLSLNSETQ